jgi:8-oxo-dGTP pyrophosphatase MutT (NUDIX family)
MAENHVDGGRDAGAEDDLAARREVLVEAGSTAGIRPTDSEMHHGLSFLPHYENFFPLFS